MGDNAVTKNTRIVTPIIMIGSATKRRPISLIRLFTPPPFNYSSNKPEKGSWREHPYDLLASKAFWQCGGLPVFPDKPPLLFNSEAKPNPLVHAPLAHNSANNFRVFSAPKEQEGGQCPKAPSPFFVFMPYQRTFSGSNRNYLAASASKKYRPMVETGLKPCSLSGHQAVDTDLCISGYSGTSSAIRS